MEQNKPHISSWNKGKFFAFMSVQLAVLLKQQQIFFFSPALMPVEMKSTLKPNLFESDVWLLLVEQTYQNQPSERFLAVQSVSSTLQNYKNSKQFLE